MLEITLVRHGETVSNSEGRYLGWTDVDLNEKGINQAKKVSSKLKNKKFDIIMSSPLKRARHTAEIIRNDNIIYDDDLKEINFGSWDNLSYKEIEKGYPEECKSWGEDWKNFIFPDGEGVLQMYKRASNFIDKLKAEHKNGSILIVTHGGIIRSITAYLLNMGLEGYWHFAVDNGSITRIKITDDYTVLCAFNNLSL
ncbi:alpha-ribazole phosphatase [Clostridium sp. CT7]|nr:alpha-ribazole phosphatase [Clostridium sp. CT7]